MRSVVILGTAGNSIDILDTINDINEVRPAYRCLGFLDDDEAKWGRDLHGVRILGPLSSAAQYRDCRFVNGIGSPSNFRRKPGIIAQTGIPDDRFLTIVHPRASVSKMSQLGVGTVVFQGAIVTSGVTIGRHVIILPNAVVSHDDVVGDFTCIAGAASISGGVRIGRSCYLGANCSIIGNVTIGDNSMVGMGSVVLKDVPSNSVVAGNPARGLSRRSHGSRRSGYPLLAYRDHP